MLNPRETLSSTSSVILSSPVANRGHGPAHVVLWTVLVLVATGCGDPEAEAAADCEVAIIGGGVGGVHTAFRLAPELGDGVCLFEKEDVLGGRLRDVSRTGSPDEPRVAVGGRRIMQGQTVLFDLADELGMILETPPVPAELISAQGAFAFSAEEFLPLYPTVTPSMTGDTETELYDALRFGPERENAGDYPNFLAYVDAVIGEDARMYLRDMTRFRSDFSDTHDAASYLDWLDEEWDVCCTACYPVGGMSTFAERMGAAIEDDGGRIFMSEPVSAIERGEVYYRITTGVRTVSAARVVIAVPPSGLDHIDGDLVAEIRAQEPYQSIVAVGVTTIAQWWEQPWWTDIVDPTQAEDNNVWRAWTTEHCLNSIEIPQEPYLASANVMRSVYNDNAECNDYWQELAAQGPAAVEADILAGLTYLFNNNGVTEPETVSIPPPLTTRMQYWPDAWHWLGPGTNSTNASLFEWALEPIAGEDVALVGEAYNIQRSAWSDAAFKSSIHLLNERYGMSLPGL